MTAECSFFLNMRPHVCFCVCVVERKHETPYSYCGRSILSFFSFFIPLSYSTFPPKLVPAFPRKQAQSTWNVYVMHRTVSIRITEFFGNLTTVKKKYSRAEWSTEISARYPRLWETFGRLTATAVTSSHYLRGWRECSEASDHGQLIAGCISNRQIRILLVKKTAEYRLTFYC